MGHTLAENVLNSLPGLVLIKEIYQEKARWIWANDACSRLCGYKNSDHSLGIFDEQMRCDAAQYAENFLVDDHEALLGNVLKLFEIYTYADGEKHVLMGEKKLFRNPGALNDQIIYQGLNIPLKQFKFSKLYSIFKTDALESYSINDKIDCLSPKESECFFYWIRGYSAKEIARQLHRSHRTIEIHLSHIKQKLGLQKKSQAIEWSIHTRAFSKIPAEFLNNRIRLDI